MGSANPEGYGKILLTKLISAFFAIQIVLRQSFYFTKHQDNRDLANSDFSRFFGLKKQPLLDNRNSDLNPRFGF